MGGFLSELTGNTALAGWLRAGLTAGLVALSQKGYLPGGVDYSTLSSSLITIVIGAWQHVAKSTVVASSLPKS